MAGSEEMVQRMLKPTHIEWPRVPDPSGPDWTYCMRRNMQEVVPGLFLGPYSAAMPSKLDTLLTNGVSHIVCVRCPMEAKIVRPKFPEKFRYLVLDINDSTTENIIQHFPAVRDFVNESFAMGGKTLIHGNAGISRSAALAIAFVMEKYGLDYKQAYGIIQARRFCVNPNEGFTQQLQAFEPIYMARLTTQYVDRENCSTGQKRRFEEEDSSQELMET